MQKKKVDFSAFSGISIPIAIVVGAMLIIWGINSLLTTEKSYKDLVQELQNKTFGNRWVAAFELSKYLNSSAIPEEDKPWLIENLSRIYLESIDNKTRNFLVIALASLKDPRVLPTLETALNDQDPEVRFHALTGIGDFPPGKVGNFPWNKVEKFLREDDPALKQVALFTLGNHKVESSREIIKQQLQGQEREVRYAAATCLILFQDSTALPTLREILKVNSKNGLTPSEFKKMEQYQLNVLTALQKSQWQGLDEELKELSQKSEAMAVKIKALELLNLHQKK